MLHRILTRLIDLIDSIAAPAPQPIPIPVRVREPRR